MIPAFYIFVAMVAVGVVLYLLDLRSRKNEPQDAAPEAPKVADCDADCCSTHEVCPSEMMLEGCNAEIVYFDDEELDAFKGRAADAYTPEEEEQFRDVLYTLLPADLLPWEQSMKKRGIILPSAIRNEFVMLYAEQQNKPQR
ncbi:MAG: phospholipase [Muribaculaceae bacterium]|nr:phospholipase [Muribaculaceae bacterium]